MIGNFWRLQEHRSVRNKDGDIADVYLAKQCWSYLEWLMSVGLDIDFLTVECDKRRGEITLEKFLGFTTERLLQMQNRQLMDTSNMRSPDEENLEYRVWPAQVEAALLKAEAYFAKSGSNAS